MSWILYALNVNSSEKRIKASFWRNGLIQLQECFDLIVVMVWLKVFMGR